MYNKMFVLGILFIAGLLILHGISYSYDRAIEAEMANTVEAPMVIADDAAASGGQYVWVEGEPASSDRDHQGWVEFVINIPEAGTYALWGKVIAWDGNSDSFWVTWQPSDPDENPQQTQNTEYRWSTAHGNNWHWDRINHWLNAGTHDRVWEFDNPSETVLRIGGREDATKLDAIFVTSNVNAVDPTSANVRLPTDEDRELQVEGLAVEAKGKVTTTWGSLKKSYR